MYVPDAYLETRRDVLVDVIRERSFGTLITSGSEGIALTHLPFVVEQRADGVSLFGHLARANAQWRSIGPRLEAVASFVVDSAYVSPSWYPSKKVTGKVVPTWNYMAVEARGTITLIDDDAGLRSLLGALTDRHEHRRAEPWSIDDAPAAFTGAMLKAIVGFRLDVTELTGAWKLDQRKSAQDRAGVVKALREEPGAAAIADAMSRTMSDGH